MGDKPLFPPMSAAQQLRTALRTDYGYTDDELKTIPDDLLAMKLHNARQTREAYEEASASLPDWIREGYVSAEEAEKLRRSELVDLYYSILALQQHRERKALVPKAKAVQPASVVADEISRSEVLNLLAAALGVIAAQQEQIEELRDQVATIHNAHVAVFGQQQVIDQFTSVPRDFEGVEVTMKLEEQSSTSADASIAASEDATSSLDSARDAAAAIDGLAKMVAGLNVGGKVNLKQMNEATRKLSERARRQARTRSKGEVHIKIAKVSRDRNVVRFVVSEPEMQAPLDVRIGETSLDVLAQRPIPTRAERQQAELPRAVGCVGGRLDCTVEHDLVHAVFTVSGHDVTNPDVGGALPGFLSTPRTPLNPHSRFPCVIRHVTTR